MVAAFSELFQLHYCPCRSTITMATWQDMPVCLSSRRTYCVGDAQFCEEDIGKVNSQSEMVRSHTGRTVEQEEEVDTVWLDEGKPSCGEGKVHLLSGKYKCMGVGGEERRRGEGRRRGRGGGGY